MTQPEDRPDPQPEDSRTDPEVAAELRGLDDLERRGDLETAADLKAERLLLDRAIGGWRGIIDSGLPTVVFVTAYLVTGSELQPSLIAAVAAGAVILVWRLFRRQNLTQVLAGFAGLAFAAWLSSRTGRAEDVFLPGLLTNLAYGSAFLISILVRWPLLGIAMGFLTGERTSWRSDPDLRRAYAASSWIWVGVFFGRLAVQVPLYLLGAVAALGIAKVVLGWPLFLGGAYLTYRVLAPIYREKRATS